MKKFFILMLMIFALICSGCSSNNNNTNSNDEVKIEVLDIGQGDASLIYTKDEVIMIDTGDVDERDRLEKLLKETQYLNYRQINNKPIRTLTISAVLMLFLKM